MSEKPIKSLSELIFRAGSPLGDLARRAADSTDLVDELRTALPAELGAELRGAALREDGTVVLLATSPAWAARLRFESAAVLARCRERHPAAKRVRVRVAGAGRAE